MERNDLISMLRASKDVSVSKAGVLHGCDEMDYGIVRASDIYTIDGSYIPIEDVVSVEFVAAMHNLVLHHNNGDESIIDGGHYSDIDREAIVLSKTPQTIAELNAVFPTLYPDSKNQLYFDEMQERAVIDMAMLGRAEEGLQPITDSIMSIYYEDLELKLSQHGFFGRPPAYIVRDNVLSIQVYNNSRNLFREWVESHVWDGKPRLRTWFADTFGATAPPLEQAGLAERYLGDVSEAWFIGGIKRMYSETKHEIVPVLIGDQGIGKGLALKYTAGRDGWYVDTSVNVKEPDKFLDAVRGNVIVEMSESTQIRSSDSEMLKSFISKSSDQLRKAYAHYNERFPRHFIFIASSNLDNIFTDITGNRRFFPMYCDPSKATRAFSQDRSVGQYDVEQVWAEALACYRGGGRWYLSEESARVARLMQDYSTQENANVTVIDDWLDDPQNGYTAIGSRINKESILQSVFAIDPHILIPRDMENAFRAWANGQRSWTKITKPVRINGKVCRAYERVCEPGFVKSIARLNIVDSVACGGDRDPVCIMRERAKKYGFNDTGDAFPTDGLEPSVIEMLMEQGYIYEGSLTPKTYKVGFLP